MAIVSSDYIRNSPLGCRSKWEALFRTEKKKWYMCVGVYIYWKELISPYKGLTLNWSGEEYWGEKKANKESRSEYNRMLMASPHKWQKLDAAWLSTFHQPVKRQKKNRSSLYSDFVNWTPDTSPLNSADFSSDAFCLFSQKKINR